MASANASVEISKMVETAETRPLAMLVRAKKRNFLSLFPFDSEADNPGSTLPESRLSEFSPTGDYFVSVEGDDSPAVIRNAVDGSIIMVCGGLKDADTPLKINFATFSPRGTFLLTWARPVSNVNVPNLVIYRISDGGRVGAFFQKTFHLDFWPSIQWSDDESIAARSVTNTIHFFHSDALDKPPHAKLGIPGVHKFSLSRGLSPYTIAAFVGAVKGGPAKVVLHRHPDDGGDQLSFRSTFRADSVKFMWNSKGTAVLALVSTNVDTTGENYYGESSVFYMNREGTIEKKVELPKKGPVHDVAWSPTGNEFIVIYGNMPSRATMFNDRCDPIFDFGSGARNTISFSIHGRFVALAGFGNLPGAVEFWDKNKMTLVGRGDLPCTTLFSWSACSRYFLAATTFPRLRVDNGIRVVRFDGVMIHQQKFGADPLYQATFRPALRGVYADPKMTMDDMIGGPVKTCDPIHQNAGESKKSEVYRPPGSRGAASTIKLNHHVQAGKVDKAQFMATATSVSAGIKQDEVGSSAFQAAKRFVPGMDPELINTGSSKAAIARKKKKERQATKVRGEASIEMSNESDAKSESKFSGDGNVGADEEDFDSVEVGEKKAKKLRKKLRTIQTLKESKQDGRELNQEQLDKLATESTLMEELANIEKKIALLSST